MNFKYSSASLLAAIAMMMVTNSDAFTVAPTTFSSSALYGLADDDIASAVERSVSLQIVLV